jgi:hypothetical protein
VLPQPPQVSAVAPPRGQETREPGFGLEHSGVVGDGIAVLSPPTQAQAPQIPLALVTNGAPLGVQAEAAANERLSPSPPQEALVSLAHAGAAGQSKSHANSEESLLICYKSIDLDSYRAQCFDQQSVRIPQSLLRLRQRNGFRRRRSTACFGRRRLHHKPKRHLLTQHCHHKVIATAP